MNSLDFEILAKLKALEAASGASGLTTAGAGLTESPAGTVNVVAANGTVTVNADSIQVGTIGDTEHGSLSGGALHAVAGAAAGFMSAADKTKLDGVSGTNTGDQVAGAGLTGTTTLNVIANADGSIVVNANDVQVGVINDTQHGTRGGGTTHANVVAAGAAGFMTGADKTKLDAISGTNTGDQVAGAGLTGTSTLNVIANADGSLVVNANDMQVGVLATDAQHGNRGGGGLHSDVVAGGASGFMTGAQATKLAGVTTGATAGVTTVGAIGTGTANVLAISGTTIVAHVATATLPGVIAAGDQQFATGVKSMEGANVLENIPAAAPTSGTTVFARPTGDLAHRPKASTRPYRVATHASARHVQTLRPAYGGSGTPTNNLAGISFESTTPTNGTIANTNLITSSPRYILTGSGAANNRVGCFESSAVNKFWRGSSAGLGGFHLTTRFAATQQSSTFRMFFGMCTVTTSFVLSTDPSGQINCVGIGVDSAGANLTFMHNDGSGTCTTSTGSSTLTKPSTTEIIECHVYCEPNGSGVYMSVEKLVGGGFSEYTASSDIPSSGTFLTWINRIGSGTAAGTVEMSLFTMQLETDF